MLQSTRHQAGASRPNGTTGSVVPPSEGSAALLDPVENISIKRGDGRHRAAYLAAATNGAWGHEWGTCGRMSMVRTVGERVELAPVLCDCWSCELCGPRRVAWLKREIGQAVTRYGLRYFWTLTIWTESCTAPESFGLCTRAWNTTATNLKRDRGRFSYVWTIEATKRGYAHLHLLVSLDVERGELSRRWRNATKGSFIVDVQSVHSARAANYLSKYCVQQATARRDPAWAELAHKRLFSKSRDVEFTPFRGAESDQESGWGVIERPYWTVAAELRQGAEVVTERTKGVPLLVVRGGRHAVC